jgi:hypothetical protein
MHGETVKFNRHICYAEKRKIFRKKFIDMAYVYLYIKLNLPKLITYLRPSSRFRVSAVLLLQT